MTPPATATPPHTARPTRRRPAQRPPRRVSGPAGGRAGGRVAPAGAALRARGGAAVAAPPLALRLGRAAARIGDARFLDRLVRGRAWIALIAAGLMGIVFVQVSMLRLNAGISRAVASAETLQRQNAELRAEISRMDSGERIADTARALGMGMPPAGSVRYLDARKANAAAAARAIRPPKEPATSAGAGATGPGATGAGATGAGATGAGAGASTSATAGTAAPPTTATGQAAATTTTAPATTAPATTQATAPATTTTPPAATTTTQAAPTTQVAPAPATTTPAAPTGAGQGG